MRFVIQRVLSARVEVDSRVCGQIGPGLLVFMGFQSDDRLEELQKLIKKMLQLRIFQDSNGKMNLSALDAKAELLLVSQFTLIADTSKGRRPFFGNAEEPGRAKWLYEEALNLAAQSGLSVASGEFAASMKVELVNDGPVTLILETSDT